MRIVYFVLLTVLFPMALMAQSPSTATLWQTDMDILQQKIYQDYPQLLNQVSPKEFDLAVKALHAQIPGMNRYEIIMGIAKIVALHRIENAPPAIQA